MNEELIITCPNCEHEMEIGERCPDCGYKDTTKLQKGKQMKTFIYTKEMQQEKQEEKEWLEKIKKEKEEEKERILHPENFYSDYLADLFT